jgi:hypothetical protein
MQNLWLYAARAAFGIEMKVYIATIENGTSIVATEKELVALHSKI